MQQERDIFYVYTIESAAGVEIRFSLFLQMFFKDGTARHPYFLPIEKRWTFNFILSWIS